MPINNVQHDGLIDIATGRSRKETNWKNREVLWSEIVEKLKTTHRTAENYTEYVTAKKIRQDEIKDIGGFVGGYLNGGRRKAGNVVHRQLLTLDIDFGTLDIWEDFLMLYGNAAVLYSTHKHSVEAPRLRLIVPLDRPVFADEYIAIARRIAGNLGIENFDHTTFEPSRLMYWPSTAKDGDYVYKFIDAGWLSADEVLATYRDWKDSSEWPVSERNYNIIQKNMRKQGDPLEKPGIIGAFCRTYNIAEAIDAFLPDVYEPCAIADRYTYKEGSTAAGVVVYDDKYAYSHHGTDPTSGKLCNAFDLVRLHKFGLKDEDARDDTPGNKLPSYVEMQAFAAKDVAVRKQLGSERLQDAKQDFDSMISDFENDPEVAENDDWLGQLDVDRKGNLKSTINNVSLILENDPLLKGKFAHDEFRRKKIVLKNLPWRIVNDDSRELRDEDEQNLVKYIEKIYDIKSRADIKDALDIHIAANGFHPIRIYLNKLKWDGEPRVDTLFVDYLGAIDSDYMQAVTRKTLVAAVSRVFHPGIKFDYVLTIVGPQGLGKSSLIGKLGKNWFSDSFNFNMLHTKEAYEQIQGAWLIEIGELAGMKKADVEAAKQFISKREDSFRVAYGRNVTTFKRQCIFFGSTNNRDFLRDPTGNRRFWPVDTTLSKPTRDVFKDLTDDEIDQIWAEAMCHYHQGETLYLSKELEEQASLRQRDHSEQDSRIGIILKYLDMLIPENWSEMGVYERRAYLSGDELQVDGIYRRNRICAAEIWCEALGGTPKEMDRNKTKEIHDLMRNMDGWKEHAGKLRFHDYGIQRGYIREGVLATDKEFYGNK
jgi:predicted P-loop ATPase